MVVVMEMSPTHDSTRAEGHLQTSVQTLTGSVGCTGRGVGSRLHAEETSKAREETTRQEGERYPGILHVQAVSHEGEKDAEHHEDDAYDLVLLLEIGHSTFTNVEGNLLHAWGTLIFCHHLTEEEKGHAQSNDRCNGHEPEYGWNIQSSCFRRPTRQR